MLRKFGLYSTLLTAEYIDLLAFLFFIKILHYKISLLFTFEWRWGNPLLLLQLIFDLNRNNLFILNRSKWRIYRYIKDILFLMIFSHRTSPLIICLFFLIWIFENNIVELKLFFTCNIIYILNVLNIIKHIEILFKIWILWEFWILLENNLVDKRSPLSWCSRREYCWTVFFDNEIDIRICFKVISIIINYCALFVLWKYYGLLIHYRTKDFRVFFHGIRYTRVEFL